MMAAIPMVTSEARSEVTLAVPPPLVMEEERRETGLLVSPDGGALGSPAWSEQEGAIGVVSRVEVEQPPMSYGVLVVDIPSDGEEDTRVMPLAILLS